MKKYIVLMSGQRVSWFDTYTIAERHAKLNAGSVWRGEQVSRIDENGHPHFVAHATPLYY